MTKKELRTEFTRLITCETIKDSYDLLDVYAECLFLIIKNHHEEPAYSQADAEAKMLVQMMLTKVLHLRSVVNGISFRAKDGTSLNKIIDPTIVASLIRNIYETTGMFNLIYRYTKSKEEKEILYLLWVHSGLTYRQRFESNIFTKENMKKLDDEKKQIDNIVATIEENELYKSLDKKNQRKINIKIKEKDYLVKFEDKEVTFLHWHELIKPMGIKDGLFENIYTYFSLYSHPSNVAVFQFDSMFKKGEETFLDLTNFNLKTAFIMISIFIADYISLFPTVIKTFDSLEIKDQIVINFNNTYARNQNYSINDSWIALE